MKMNLYTMKSITKSAEERKYLTKAYFAWENLADDVIPNSRDEYEYRKAINKYRDSWNSVRKYRD
jgi:hypothetical protein